MVGQQFPQSHQERGECCLRPRRRNICLRPPSSVTLRAPCVSFSRIRRSNMAVTKQEKSRLTAISAPDSQTVKLAARRYLALTNLSIAQFANEVGRAYSTI